ncbi:MAG: hypothetical protein HFE86_00385 [Clostridiales bacterium]|nr:hypothetical protein [Clostridiales bacterium]
MKRIQGYRSRATWILSAALLLGMGGSAGMDHWAVASGPDQVLFSSSFEENDGLELLESTAGQRPAEQVSNTYLYGIRGSVSDLVELSSVTGNGGSGDEGMQKLFDRNLDTKSLWIQDAAPTADAPAWVSVKLAEEQVVRTYALCAGNDASERDPAAWVLYGSDDGNSWTALDNRLAESFDSRKQENVYTFQNETPYM